jgi:hypothetical protein
VVKRDVHFLGTKVRKWVAVAIALIYKAQLNSHTIYMFVSLSETGTKNITHVYRLGTTHNGVHF